VTISLVLLFENWLPSQNEISDFFVAAWAGGLESSYLHLSHDLSVH